MRPEAFDVVAVRWRDGAVELLDQGLLPHEETWVQCRTVGEVAEAIKELVVRGAPAIGIAAAYGMALAGSEPGALDAAAEELEAARPTAVNLMWAVDRVRRSGDVLSEAHAIAAEEHDACRRIGAIGADLVPARAEILTHCNAGALATGGYGSALGVARAAVEAGKHVHVWAGETRPLLQGARLTTWELARAEIPCTLIVDAAGPALLAAGKVHLVVVGADRIAANGDTANKIGTYSLALAAHTHGVPFYVAAPTSTIDLATPDGEDIQIEERDPAEVCSPAAPPGQPAYNPAFDVTPAGYITAFITDKGLVRPPYGESLVQLVV